MGFFARTIRRGAKTADAVGATDTSSTSASAHGETTNTPSPLVWYPIATSVRLDEHGVPVSLLSSMAKTKSNSARTSGSGSRLTRFAMLLSRSTAAFGTRLRGKKKQTDSPFLVTLEAETRSVVGELSRSVNRQLVGDPYWHATRRLSVRERVVLKLHKKHKGKWIHHPEYWYYEDCECCGQPVKKGHEEYWSRTCDTCGHYESRDIIPTTRKRWFH